ncbi:hypothetical protein ABVK25_005211 [Lepraria finkii]|uniref:DUF6604 domain-containing protein n=1 Tax=Lepraria finkii TaxID=1340010 RepID=A0ABR4B9C1_9LECA
MLPEVLYQTYRLYKCDTDCFVSWLSETAIICGHAVRLYPAPIVAASSISDDGPVTTGGVTTGRLKCKARKEAKIATKKAASSRPAPERILAVRQPHQQDCQIQQRVGTAPEPSPIRGLKGLSQLERNVCNAWFQGRELEGEGCNDTHVYSVEVLGGKTWRF